MFWSFHKYQLHFISEANAGMFAYMGSYMN